MADRITIQVSFGPESATIVLDDPFGTDNPWSATPEGVLSAYSGKWAQGLRTLSVELTGPAGHVVIRFVGLDTFAPAVGKEGDTIHYGEGGTIGDGQTIHWRITKVE